mgnify:CR=1 FL=1
MISRSKGIVPPGPWMGPLPGGGYSGATEVLDRIVAEAAKRLAAWSGEDVEIRFNSDRMSGGAYVGTPKNGFSSVDEVGVGAGYVADIDRSAFENGTMEDHNRIFRAAPKVLEITVLAGVNRLENETLATLGCFGGEYAMRACGGTDVDSAIAWIAANCKKEKTVRVTENEIAAWKKKRVAYVATDGTPGTTSLFEVIRQAGAKKGDCADEEEIAAWLRQTLKLAGPDAARAARGVVQIMPRRK